MWNPKEAILGTLKAKVRTTAEFVYTPPTGAVVLMKKVGNGYDIHTSCGCSSGNWNPITYTLTVSFTPQPVSMHLIASGTKHYFTTKTISGTLIVDGVEEPFTLSFSAKIVN